MQLTKNFSLDEMLESPTARRLKMVQQFSPDILIRENLLELCTKVLQPLRDYIGPINVNSGYRCPELNYVLGGAKNSQHLYGQAADIQAVGKITNKMIYETIIELKLPIDQVIWEYGTDENPSWVHVSYGPRHRRQQLRIK